MEDLGKKIKIKIENETIEFVLLKEVTYKKNNYVLVMDEEKDECGCHDNCEDECEKHHDKECENHCEDECGCCNEKTIYIFKMDKDKKYSFIEDEKELDEVIEYLDKTFYED